MPTPPSSEDQSPATESVSSSTAVDPTNLSGSSTTRQQLTTLAAIGLLISYFLPWINLLGAKLNGVDIQKNFSSYKLVWIIPLFALIALIMNLAKLPAKVVSQLAGFSPFFTLCYAAYRLNSNLSDLFRVLEFGAWVALGCGLVLVVAACDTKKPSMLD